MLLLPWKDKEPERKKAQLPVGLVPHSPDHLGGAHSYSLHFDFEPIIYRFYKGRSTRVQPDGC